MPRGSSPRWGTVARTRPVVLVLSAWLMWSFGSIVSHAAAPVAHAGRPTQVQDLSTWLAARDRDLGSSPGTIVLDQPGTVATPVTLGLGHDLHVRANVAWNATVRLQGHNTVRCDTGVTVTAHLPAYEFPKRTGMLLLATSASGVEVSGCHVTAAAANVLLAGYPASDVTMTGNVLEGLTLLALNGTVTANTPAGVTSQHITLTGNSVSIGKGGQHAIGAALFYAKGVVAAGNHFSGLGHGMEWWGGDAGAAGAALAGVTAAGQMTFTDNQCKDIAGACIWGSMASDVVIRGNTADGCGDVCFDTEGGLRTQMLENTATRCRNGCAGIFFFSDQTTISGNHFRAAAPGGGLIFIKNASANPLSHDHLTVAKNELTCTTPCRAVYQEAVSGVEFVGNEVVDGTWAPMAYARSVRIEGNRFVLKQVASGPMTTLRAPAVIGGTSLAVVDNTIDSVPQPPGSVCIAATWSDYNAADTQLIAGNTCGPNGAFSTGLSAVSTGKNPGLAGVWIVSGNRFGGGAVVHPPVANERFLDLGECGAAGCQVNGAAVRAAAALPGCAGRPPASAAGTTPVCLGAAGWAAVPLAR